MDVPTRHPRRCRHRLRAGDDRHGRLGHRGADVARAQRGRAGSAAQPHGRPARPVTLHLAARRARGLCAPIWSACLPSTTARPCVSRPAAPRPESGPAHPSASSRCDRSVCCRRRRSMPPSAPAGCSRRSATARPFAVEVRLPPPVVGPAWAAQLPPRSGWEERAVVPVAAVLDQVSVGVEAFRRRVDAPRRVRPDPRAARSGSPRTSGAVRPSLTCRCGSRTPRSGWGSSAARATYAHPPSGAWRRLGCPGGSILWSPRAGSGGLLSSTSSRSEWRPSEADPHGCVDGQRGAGDVRRGRWPGAPRRRPAGRPPRRRSSPGTRSRRPGGTPAPPRRRPSSQVSSASPRTN